MRRAIINADGQVVNLVEVEQSTLDNGEWAPPAGHTHIAATTDEDHKLNIGDSVHTATGQLTARKAVPVPPVLPVAEILVYDDDENTPQHQFNVGDTVNIRVTLPVTVTGRTIAVPIDRLDADGRVVEAAVAWFKLEVNAGVGHIAAVFSRSGCYGVGPRTSKEFAVPENVIVVFE